MYKITKKMLISIFVLFVMVNLFSITANAATNLTTMESQTSSFLSNGKQNSVNISNATKDLVNLGKILTTIGAGIMVGVVTYMGIKYLIAGPEAQAKLKGQLIGVVVSGCVIFGAYTIWKIVVQVAETF